MRVLYLDDEPLVARAMAGMIRDLAPVATQQSAREALALLAYGPWDVILSDFALSGSPSSTRAPTGRVMDGVDFLRLAAEMCPSARRILVTGSPDHPKVRAAVLQGVAETALGKPVPRETLRLALLDGKATREEGA